MRCHGGVRLVGGDGLALAGEGIQEIRRIVSARAGCHGGMAANPRPRTAALSSTENDGRGAGRAGMSSEEGIAMTRSGL